MLLVAGAILGLVAGLLTGGSIQNVLSRRMRWPLVVIVAFLVKELEIRTPLGFTGAAPFLFVLSLAVLIAWTIWHVRELPGIWMVGVGMTMNLVVVLANGGRMPVISQAALRFGPRELADQGVWAQYAVMGPDTRLNWLADWILVPRPLGIVFPQAYSPGDLVSLVGLTVVMFLITRPRHRPAVEGAITSR